MSTQSNSSPTFSHSKAGMGKMSANIDSPPEHIPKTVGSNTTGNFLQINPSPFPKTDIVTNVPNFQSKHGIVSDLSNELDGSEDRSDMPPSSNSSASTDIVALAHYFEKKKNEEECKKRKSLELNDNDCNQKHVRYCERCKNILMSQVTASDMSSGNFDVVSDDKTASDEHS